MIPRCRPAVKDSSGTNPKNRFQAGAIADYETGSNNSAGHGNPPDKERHRQNDRKARRVVRRPSMVDDDDVRIERRAVEPPRLRLAAVSVADVERQVVNQTVGHDRVVRLIAGDRQPRRTRGVHRHRDRTEKTKRPTRACVARAGL